MCCTDLPLLLPHDFGDDGHDGVEQVCLLLVGGREREAGEEVVQKVDVALVHLLVRGCSVARHLGFLI